ncbi:hypothetical protein ASC94_11890 [Massilia sp. Root418]|nr:hypothetical protein [Massilia sp. Root418]KQW93340.1 hypothetical protein ASC94_11890 [Massilia sp. Root418]
MSIVQDLSLEFFSAHEGALFSVAGSDGMVLRLAAVQPAGMPGYGRAQAFSLMFEGPAQPRLEQATIRLSNDAAGEFDIFVVPVGANADLTRYQAVFN